MERACGLDRIPVFVKYGSVLPVGLNNGMCMGTTAPEGRMGNTLGKYENFALLIYGGLAEADIEDDAAGKFRLSWSKGKPVTEGERRCPVTVFLMEEELPCPNGDSRVGGNIFGRSMNGVRIE